MTGYEVASWVSAAYGLTATAVGTGLVVYRKLRQTANERDLNLYYRGQLKEASDRFTREMGELVGRYGEYEARMIARMDAADRQCQAQMDAMENRFRRELADRDKLIRILRADVQRIDRGGRADSAEGS